jgi:hypothetical protein
MSNSTRGEARRAFLRSALEVAGAAVLASTVVPAAQASIVETSGTPQARADRLAIVSNQDVTDDSEALIRHVNNAFVNGGFRKGAFANGGGGGFRNGGFANGGGGGGFRKGAFANGGGGGFKNGGFVNGGFRNY